MNGCVLRIRKVILNSILHSLRRVVWGNFYLLTYIGLCVRKLAYIYILTYFRPFVLIYRFHLFAQLNLPLAGKLVYIV
jgi:hypothetical protein